MLIRATILVALSCVIGANSHAHHDVDVGLKVTTRTGTFIGDLNDTYPDVRQFKWIPYAKVPLNPQEHLHYSSY